MSEQAAGIIWMALGLYAGLGGFVALIAFARLARFDAEAARAPFYVKLLWAPGLVALWPLMLARLFKLSAPR
jgi:hypothetical protein